MSADIIRNRRLQSASINDYQKTCKDFAYTGVKCCSLCHETGYDISGLEVCIVDGQPVLLCCTLHVFFYPLKEDGSKITPEEKLLRAIFGGRPHLQAK
jgi:hypothetical protein